MHTSGLFSIGDKTNFFIQCNISNNRAVNKIIIANIKIKLYIQIIGKISLVDRKLLGLELIMLLCQFGIYVNRIMIVS